MVDEAEIVFVVYQDPASAWAVSFVIVKCDDRIKEIAKGRASVKVKMVAILCRELAEAVALAQVFGNDKPPKPDLRLVKR